MVAVRDQAYIVVSYECSDFETAKRIQMMTFVRPSLLLALVFVIACDGSATDDEIGGRKLIIAHRGASGYLPEHTIAAKAMAYAQGVDFIEQDLVMSKDNEVIVLHDYLLDTVSNVRNVFPGRSRDDGSFYVVDFTLDEIRTLSVLERFEFEAGEMLPVFSDRFPLGASSFRIHTFVEEIELIQGLNKSTGNSIGIYPEIKSPAFHRSEGKDISNAVLNILKEYGYTSHRDNVFLQCFDPKELIRIHDELLPAKDMSLPLIQLLGASAQYKPMLSEEGMQNVSKYAVGIGPSIWNLVENDSTISELKLTELSEWARAAGLQVHAYTFRRDAGQIPPYAKDFEDLLKIFFVDVGVDGVFTDFPDLAVDYVESNF
jgi:glycerophosphoryl diester phosphodiesterase